jgi:hypothetical protein
MLIRTAKATDDRMERGMRIFQSGLVRPISPGCFVVASESDDKVYYIVRADTGCTCRDASDRHMLCKHVWACFISAAMTIWGIQDAVSKAEIDALLALRTSPMPAGIGLTIRLEAQRAFERLRAS